MNFPNVPNVPGVPPLLRNPLAAVVEIFSLLTQDSVVFSDDFAPQWGIFQDGVPVIVADNVVSLEYKQNWYLADYPIEQGGFESYDKVQVPFDSRIRFSSGGSEQNRQALLDSIAGIAGDLNLYDIVTPEEIYQSVNVIQYNYKRSATNGVGLISVDVWCQEVRVNSQAQFTNSGTGSDSTLNGNQAPPITNSKSPSSVSSINSGNVQPSPPTEAQFGAITSGLQF